MAIYRRRRSVEVAGLALALEEAPALDEAGGDADGTAASDDAAITPSAWAGIAGAVVFVVGAILGYLGLSTDGPVEFVPPAGIGAFAVFYVLAQGVERLIEFIDPVLQLIPRLGKKDATEARDAAVAAADSGGSGEDAANAQAALDQIRTDRRFVLTALAAALGMWLSGWFEVDFLAAIGVTNAGVWISVIVTGLVIGGGTAKLHSLITNVQKASEKKSDPPETGGES